MFQSGCYAKLAGLINIDKTGLIKTISLLQRLPECFKHHQQPKVTYMAANKLPRNAKYSFYIRR